MGNELTEITTPDQLNSASPSKEEARTETRANQGTVVNLLRDKLGVNDGSGFILFRTARHGSPHRFLKFALVHIGRGEERQASQVQVCVHLLFRYVRACTGISDIFAGRMSEIS